MNKMINLFGVIIFLIIATLLSIPVLMAYENYCEKHSMRRSMNRIEKLLESGKEEKVLEKIKQYIVSRQEKYDGEEAYKLEKSLIELELK